MCQDKKIYAKIDGKTMSPCIKKNYLIQKMLAWAETTKFYQKSLPMHKIGGKSPNLRGRVYPADQMGDLIFLYYYNN
jgi:hypothetical protein